MLAEDADERLEAFARLLGVGIDSEAQRARLALQASIDVQTGVLNHGAFHARLDEEVSRALRHGRALAVATVDIDHLQRVNHRHGHHSGDELIAAVAGVLVRTARSEDVIGRIGGDKFGVLLPESDRVIAMAAMDRARAAIGRLGVGGLHVTVSAGVCDLEMAGDAPRMLRLADQALCCSKANGRDRVWVYDEQIAGVVAPPPVEADRATALAGIRALARAIDAKDSLTRQHSERVAVLACLLADRLGWSQARMEALHQAGLVHDVGKIGVPDAVLLKPGQLTGHEYELVKRHATLGAEIVQDVLTIEQVAWVRGHHERPDGTGYPDGLRGDEVAEGAALLALADAFDVMTVRRAYGDPRTVGSAVDECVALRGRQFAPAAVDALVALHEERRLTAFTDFGWHRRIARADVEPMASALSAPRAVAAPG
jgi:diguanylate cyclase (GGDEF)-like protein